jgi:hypothetical protein
MQLRALVLCVACMACASTPVELPPTPTPVYSALGPVPVVLVDSLRTGDGRSALAGFHTILRTIYVRYDVAASRMLTQVLEHEKCHVALYDAGITVLLPSKLEDAVCDAIGTYQAAQALQTRKSTEKP